jgi:SAM-dependent methyltransferase
MMQLLFSVTLFVAAVLLFSIQLFTSKMLLPVLGGSAAVWNTCLVFFQLALLLGYLYAHGVSRWLTYRFSILAHPALLLAAASMLPVSIAGLSNPPGDANPIPWLLKALLFTVGPPFVILAGTAPLLQAWFSRIGDRSSRDPYFLYAASNLGSLVALVSYPTVIEPHLSLADQSRWWTAGYVLLMGLTAACAAAAHTRARGSSQHQASDPPAPGNAIVRGSWLLRMRWVLLAFVPSSLLLGVTSHLTTDVAAAPLFWVIPLTLYLLSFVLAFQQLVTLPENRTKHLQALLLVSLAVTLLTGQSGEPIPLFALHLAAFFMTALLCHQEVARLRPPTGQLTEFYLLIAVGGALGGIFNALLAPIVFTSVVEYPLVLVLACMLRPGLLPSLNQRRAAAGDFVLPALLFLLVIGLQRHTDLDLTDLRSTTPLVLVILIALVVFSVQSRPVRFGLSIAALIAGGVVIADTDQVLVRVRNFYGVLRVIALDSPPAHVLFHGTTTHGTQSLDPARRLEPLSYYHHDGPLGQLFEAAGGSPVTRHVAIVGLGAGTIACYAHRGEHWTFFEINPAVVAIAQDSSLFTFLKDCPARPDLVLGDARLSLAQEPDASFDMIILDAFTSDAIPIHLMTRNAVQLYLAKLRPGGLLVFHISNRYLELAPVLGNISGSLGLVARRWSDEEGSDDANSNEASAKMDQKDASEWVIIARREQDLAAIAEADQWEDLPPAIGQGVWTDDYSNVLAALSH